jgi:hypothetical protein
MGMTEEETGIREGNGIRNDEGMIIIICDGENLLVFVGNFS